MTSSVSTALRLPAVISRGPRVQEPAGPRHLAADDGILRVVEAGPELTRTGRHAEPEWSRLAFDAKRDDDPLDWLGFSSDPA
jgi:hypothetical protein